MWPWVWSNIDKLSYVATVITALIAGIALGFTWAQIVGARGDQRRSFAHDLYRDYLSLAFENPKLANPILANFDYEKRTIDGCQKDFERYEWFVSVMLDACQEILASDEKAASRSIGYEWYITIETQLRYHKKYLLLYYLKNRTDPEYLAQYSPLLKTVMLNVLTGDVKAAE